MVGIRLEHQVKGQTDFDKLFLVEEGRGMIVGKEKTAYMNVRKLPPIKT